MELGRIQPGIGRFSDRVLMAAALAAVMAVMVAMGVVAVRAGAAMKVDIPAASLPVPASSISRLDPLSPMPASLRPKSAEPVGGMVFVRCTHLWAALPDGTRAYLLLSKPGLASPAFSPDSRTIAFLAEGAGGPEIWMTAADGTAMTKVGSLTSDGTPVRADAQSLEWSSESDTVVFTLTTIGDDRATGSSTWKLDVPTGTLSRVATGAMQASWIGKHLIGSAETSAGLDLVPLGDEKGNSATTMAKRLSSDGEDLAVAAPPAHWYGIGTETTAVLVEDASGSVQLELHDRAWNPHSDAAKQLPDGERIDPSSRPAVSSDGSFVGVDLIGTDGGRDMGLFDTLTRRWTVMDYAWNPVWSTTTPALPSPQLWRASNVARAFLGSWDGARSDARMFLSAPVRGSLMPFGGMGYTIGDPNRTANGWSVPVTVYGHHGEGFAYRRISLYVHADGGRLVVRPFANSPIKRLRTVEQAVRFMKQTLTVEVVAPAGLPVGAKLAPRPISAWSWNSRATGSLRLLIPFGGNGKKLLTVGYDDGGFGCGSQSKPIDISGTQGDTVTSGAIADGSTAEVIWPAKPGAPSAPFSVAGNLPRRVLLRIAEATEAARRAV